MPATARPARPRAVARSDCADARSTAARPVTRRRGSCPGSARARRRHHRRKSAQDGGRSAQPWPRMQPDRVVERDAGKHREAQPVIGEEGAEAAVALASADEPQVIDGQRHGDRKTCPEQGRPVRGSGRPRPGRRSTTRSSTRRRDVEAAEGHAPTCAGRAARRRRGRPSHTRCRRRSPRTDWPRTSSSPSGGTVPIDGGERHRDAERKCDAEKGLRQRQEALAERIDDRDGQRQRRIAGPSAGWCHTRPARRRAAANAAATTSASHGSISPRASGRPAVRVTCASKSRSAQSLSAQPAQRISTVPTVNTTISISVGAAERRQPQRRQRRPQQQQDADRLVQPHQPFVGIDAPLPAAERGGQAGIASVIAAAPAAS